MQKYTLCKVDDLADKRCKSVVIESGGQRMAAFVVRMSATTFYGYENRCPHTGAPLNWQPDQFFALDYHYLQCGMHGALLQVHDGLCVHGPCLGQRLQALKLYIEDGTVYAEIGQKTL